MSSTELLKIAKTLDSHAQCESKDLDALFEAAEEIGKSFSGSWLGYHSCVYYENFKIPPSGERFSQEWGLDGGFSGGTRGPWIEYQFDDVVSLIQGKAGNPSIKSVLELSEKAKVTFDNAKTKTLSILHTQHNVKSNEFLTALAKDIEQEKILRQRDFINIWRPRGKIMSRDMSAAEKGLPVPPHFSILVQVLAIKHPFKACENLQNLIIKVSDHIKLMKNSGIDVEKTGTKIFIGHGGSLVWKEIRDFVQNRLNLPWDEFNRVSAAGITNADRLSEMLDQACFAFLILTAEDEKTDGDYQARMNVIHEVGLFQGRLGFNKAIVLLEDKCSQFTNIEGIGQIRFTKDNIPAIFEKIRHVLEREKIIKSS